MNPRPYACCPTPAQGKARCINRDVSKLHQLTIRLPSVKHMSCCMPLLYEDPPAAMAPPGFARLSAPQGQAMSMGPGNAMWYTNASYPSGLNAAWTLPQGETEAMFGGGGGGGSGMFGVHSMGMGVMGGGGGYVPSGMGMAGDPPLPWTQHTAEAALMGSMVGMGMGSHAAGTTGPHLPPVDMTAAAATMAAASGGVHPSDGLLSAQQLGGTSMGPGGEAGGMAGGGGMPLMRRSLSRCSDDGGLGLARISEGGQTEHSVGRLSSAALSATHSDVLLPTISSRATAAVVSALGVARASSGDAGGSVEGLGSQGSLCVEGSLMQRSRPPRLMIPNPPHLPAAAVATCSSVATPPGSQQRGSAGTVSSVHTITGTLESAVPPLSHGLPQRSASTEPPTPLLPSAAAVSGGEDVRQARHANAPVPAASSRSAAMSPGQGGSGDQGQQRQAYSHISAGTSAAAMHVQHSDLVEDAGMESSTARSSAVNRGTQVAGVGRSNAGSGQGLVGGSGSGRLSGTAGSSGALQGAHGSSSQRASDAALHPSTSTSLAHLATLSLGERPSIERAAAYYVASGSGVPADDNVIMMHSPRGSLHGLWQPEGVTDAAQAGPDVAGQGQGDMPSGGFLPGFPHMGYDPSEMLQSLDEEELTSAHQSLGLTSALLRDLQREGQAAGTPAHAPALMDRLNEELGTKEQAAAGQSSWDVPGKGGSLAAAAAGTASVSSTSGRGSGHSVSSTPGVVSGSAAVGGAGRRLDTLLTFKNMAEADGAAAAAAAAIQVPPAGAGAGLLTGSVVGAATPAIPLARQRRASSNAISFPQVLLQEGPVGEGLSMFQGMATVHPDGGSGSVGGSDHSHS